MNSLIQQVMSAVSPDLVSRMGGFLGESASGTGQGLEMGSAALLAGATQQASTSEGASRLLGMVQQATARGNPLDNANAAYLDDAARPGLLSEGHSMVSSLLGGNSGSVVSQLASVAHLGPQSVSSILAMAAPLVLGALAKFVGPNATPAALHSLLSGQRSDILAALPVGMRSLFGAPAAAASAATAAVAPAAPGIGRLLPWLLAAVALVLLLLFGLRTCKKEAVTPVAPVGQLAPPAVAPRSVVMQLPGGGSISVRENSIGYSVAQFLASNQPAPKIFVFDNLNFDTASNALTPESKPTVDALATILKAYPNARSRVVGYTDNQGDPAANKTLSDQRATTVKNELVARGVPAATIDKAGMGEEHPIGDNATEEGRAQNRRTELEITQK
jgi:outer membrane protein OmpA-like peptidoglycan-associated protein